MGLPTDDIFAARQAMQQRVKGGEQQHKERDAFLLAEGFQLVGKVPGDRAGLIAGEVLRDIPTRLIGGKTERGEIRAKLLLPIGSWRSS